jgi:hypothetical protein
MTDPAVIRVLNEIAEMRPHQLIELKRRLEGIWGPPDSGVREPKKPIRPSGESGAEVEL